MLEKVAKDAWEYGRKFLLQGKVADHIPELEKANPVHFGLCIKTEEQKKHKIKSFNADIYSFHVTVDCFTTMNKKLPSTMGQLSKERK